LAQRRGLICTRFPPMSSSRFRSRTMPQSLAQETCGVADHVHILCRLSRTMSIADLVAELKRESSKWIKVRDPRLAKFHWQDGYGAFSISPSHVEALQEYIRTQEEHHRHEGFQAEFRRILEKYEVEFDERYVWD
jgi:putative transposase